MPEPKEWTVMFYFASDNPLASTIVSQLKALKDAGYHPDANVIAHFDPHTPNTPVHVFDVNHVNKFWYPNQSEVGFTKNDPFVRDLVLDRLWGETNQDIRNDVVEHLKTNPEYKERPFDPPMPSAAMSRELDPKDALANFLDFCKESYPARHYMLFILGHGEVMGTDLLLYDAHAERHSLTIAELGEVLRTFNRNVQNDKNRGEVELITLHSCSMSSLEVAYEFKGAAKYLLASQGPTYVGNLPYKQILIRVFNDLNLGLKSAEINGVHGDGKISGQQSFVTKLAQAKDLVSESLREQLTVKLKDNELREELKKKLDQYVPGTAPDSTFVDDIVKGLNSLTTTWKSFNAVMNSGNGTDSEDSKKFVDLPNRRRNLRLFLADKYPEIARYPQPGIDEKLLKIFYYCLYNSLDYQLAGYPFDLCLTNLNRVSESEEPMKRLVSSLINGLDNPKARQLILLAHWDAQSFYSEDYVDLYDFCFCLRRRCDEIEAKSQFEEIYNACDGMIDVLEKGPDKLVKECAFAGAAFQYSHGHSIYFPWAQPVENKAWHEQYTYCRLNEKTCWGYFLRAYFEKTRRQPRFNETKPEGEQKEAVEKNDNGNNPWSSENISKTLLEMIGRVGNRAFVGDGGLGFKPGPDHPMGKWGPDDPSGANCNCQTIKNYPPFTKIVSVNFFDGVKTATDPEDDGMESQMTQVTTQ